MSERVVVGWYTRDYLCWANWLRKDLDGLGEAHNIIEVPTIPGGWARNTLRKPAIVRQFRERFPHHVLILLDVDCRVYGSLEPLALSIHGDVAARVLSRTTGRGKDRARIKIMSGTMVWRGDRHQRDRRAIRDRRGDREAPAGCNRQTQGPHRDPSLRGGRWRHRPALLLPRDGRLARDAAQPRVCCVRRIRGGTGCRPIIEGGRGNAGTCHHHHASRQRGRGTNAHTLAELHLDAPGVEVSGLVRARAHGRARQGERAEAGRPRGALRVGAEQGGAVVMSTPHSPGPWVACDPGDYSDYDGRSVVILNDDRKIAAAIGQDDVAVANARLMAAAPELAEALKAMLDVEGTESIDELRAAAARGRAALARARGGTQP